MNAEPWLLAAGAALLVFWMLGAHNRLVALRNQIIAAWAQVDKPLRRRSTALQALLAEAHTLLPAEQPAVDAVAAAQAQLLLAAEALRQRPTLAVRAAALAGAEATLAPALARLVALLDAHPMLAPHVAALQDAQQRMAFARQLFNDAVRAYNAAAHQFPTRLLSRLFGFGESGLL